MNVTQVLSELAEIKTFMDRQVASERDVSVMATSQAAAFCKKVHKLSTLNAPQANQLVDAFDACAFGNDHKAQFQEAVSSKLMGDVQEDTSQGKTQHIKIDRYMLEQKWKEMGDTRFDISRKPELMKQCFFGIGCFYPSEPSLARAAIILATHGCGITNPTVETLRNLLLNLKRTIQAGREHGPRTFPFSPIKHSSMMTPR